jgi:hypothetical protein
MCFDASMHHVQGVLLLHQSYMPVKIQSTGTYNPKRISLQSNQLTVDVTHSVMVI